MERNLKKIGLVNLVVLFVVGVVSTFLARYSNSLSAQSGIIFLGLGFLVIAIGYFQMRLEDAERLEKLEFEELNKSAANASIFNITEADVFPAQRSREQFERFFVPAFTVVLFLLQAGGAYWLWSWLSKVVQTGLQQPTVAMSLFGLFALALFLLGKYAVGLTRLEGARLLRPGANYLLLDAYVCFVITICIAGVQLGFPRVDYYAAWVLAGFLGLVAAETLISLVLEIYRPRVKGKVGRVLYDSRLVGLMAEPEGLFTTAAHALDYQFGFKVSETWFYRFLEKALAWLIILQLVVLFVSTSFVFISPGEQGLLERFGSPVANQQVLEPGLHLKLPWPVDRVYRFRTREIQSLNIGFVPGEEEAHGGAVLWTAKHYEEESNWLVASRANQSQTTNEAGNASERGIPVDLVNVSVPVQFQIRDLRAWAYQNVNASNLLEKLATREVVRYLASVDFIELMSTGRGEAAEELRRRIQQAADGLSLGADIVYVGLEDLHPPVKVAPDFEKVVGAWQEIEQRRYEAEGYAAKAVAEARGNAAQLVNDIHGYSNRVVLAARAQAGQFTNQVLAYNASPRAFMGRSYLQSVMRGITNSDKYIWATSNSNDLFQMNLEQKIRRDLIEDLNIPAKTR